MQVASTFLKGQVQGLHQRFRIKSKLFPTWKYMECFSLKNSKKTAQTKVQNKECFDNWTSQGKWQLEWLAVSITPLSHSSLRKNISSCYKGFSWASLQKM
jgi:hypothetical protein